MSVISDVPAGLGIDIYASQSSSLRTSRCDPIPSIARHQSADSGLPATNSHPTLRSMTAMQGLLLAESGDGMVELDPYARDGSGFREGQRFTGTAGGRSRLSRTGSSYTDSSTEGSSLSRHGTLLSFGASDGRTAAELKSLMGNGNSRLKSGATVLPPPGQPQKRSKDALDTVVLEQAKTHARVEVDIVLESYTGIQGNYFKGLIKVRVRKQSKKEEGPLLLGAGKLRIIGFECIPNEEDQHTFYQCAAPLTDITQSAQKLYASTPDNEGFCEGREGVHVLPFSIFLPITGATGKPKGALHLNSGVTVRYIAIASVKVKNPETGKHSIAHFYRNCEIWPRLNPTLILASAPRPLRAVTAKSLFMGGPGKLKLTACIHRLHWIAGQRCHVAVSVDNATKKTVRSLTLTLVRTTIVFRPQAHLDPLPASAMRSADPDACQTTTTEKHVAETRLEMGNHGAKGHASAKGWWTGVSAGDTLDFSHSIVIPEDTLSVTRGRLLEVEYSIRVGLSAGTLASDVHVVLPIRIVNFLSIDPPPSSPMHRMTDSTISSASSISSAGKPPNRMSRDGLPRSCPKSVFRPLDSDESLSATSRRYEDPSDYADDDTQMDSGPPTRTGSQVSTASSTSDYANTDDELSSVLREESIRAPRFADLYIAEQREREQQQPDTRPPYDAAYHSRSEDDVERSAARRRDRSKTVTAREAPSMHANASKRQSLGPRSPPIDGMVAGRNEGPSPFALRVKEKLQAAALADGLLLQRDRVSSMSSFGCISASASNLGTESGSVQRTDAETDSEEDALARAWSPRSEEALQRQTVVQLSDSSSSSVMRRAARDPRRSVLEDHPEMDEDDHTPVQPSGSQFRTLPRTPSMQGGLSALASLHDVPEHGPPRISYTTSVPAHGPSSSASANSTVAARTRSVCSGAREMGRPSRTGGSEQVSSVRNKILQLEIRVQEADDFERGE